jgi:hypothetical protein
MNTLLPIISLILTVLSLLLASYCAWEIFKLNKLKKFFFTGKTTENLEDVFLSLTSQIQSIVSEQKVTEDKLGELEYRLGLTVQKVGVVKFNPFSDSGGNFSFSLALLDQHNSGVVLTSMHGREQNRIYAKIILGGRSESKLTEEEERAVLEADGKFQALTKNK